MSEKKGILILGNYPPPYGGVPRHIEDLVPYLAKRGWDVHVLSGGKTGIERYDGITVYKDKRSRLRKLVELPALLAKMIVRNRLRCLYLVPCVPFADWLAYLGRAQLGAEIIEGNRIDLISAYNLTGGAPTGVVLSELYNLPLVVTNFGEIYSRTNFFRNHRNLIGYILQRARRLVSMTRHCAESYKLLGLTPNVSIIPIGVDTQRFSPSRDAGPIREKLGLADSDRIVLFVGRMIEEMGLHTLLAAAPAVLENSPCKIVIAGASGDLLPRAFELAHRYEGRIVVSPDVPLEELPLYYALCTLLVAPTQGDRACGALAAAEAMASGKPVVATRVGGVPEFVLDGVTGILIPPEEPETLAKAVLELLNDIPLALVMGKRGRERAVNVLDKEKTNYQYEHLFRETAAACGKY